MDKSQVWVGTVSITGINLSMPGISNLRYFWELGSWRRCTPIIGWYELRYFMNKAVLYTPLMLIIKINEICNFLKAGTMSSSNLGEIKGMFSLDYRLKV